MLIAFDRHTLTASDVLTIAYRYGHDLRFRTAASRNPERMIQRKDFFFGFDFQDAE